jgi:hypothetical protein
MIHGSVAVGPFMHMRHSGTYTVADLLAVSMTHMLVDYQCHSD